MVTSEPVPAVVGIAISGGPLRGTWSTPNKSASAVVTGVSRNTLGNVDGTAAAHADQAVMPAFAVHAHAVLDNGDFRVGQHTVENLIGALAQVLKRQRDGTGLDQRGIGDDQRVIHIQTRELGGQLFNGASAGQQFMGDLE